MRPQDVRQAEQELLNVVLVSRQDLCMKALFKLLEMRVQKLKDRLVSCAPEEFLTVQAEARAMQKLVTELNKPVQEAK